MVEEFLEKLPEIDTRYEVSTQQTNTLILLYLYRVVATTLAAGMGWAGLLFRASSSHLLDILFVLLILASSASVCFAVQITFAPTQAFALC